MKEEKKQFEMLVSKHEEVVYAYLHDLIADFETVTVHYFPTLKTFRLMQQTSEWSHKTLVISKDLVVILLQSNDDHLKNYSITLLSNGTGWINRVEN